MVLVACQPQCFARRHPRVCARGQHMHRQSVANCCSRRHTGRTIAGMHSVARSRARNAAARLARCACAHMLRPSPHLLRQKQRKRSVTASTNTSALAHTTNHKRAGAALLAHRAVVTGQVQPPQALSRPGVRHDPAHHGHQTGLPAGPAPAHPAAQWRNPQRRMGRLRPAPRPGQRWRCCRPRVAAHRSHAGCCRAWSVGLQYSAVAAAGAAAAAAARRRSAALTGGVRGGAYEPGAVRAGD